MELRAIKYFLQVYEQGSVSGAAKRCFVSQPSITTAIQSLETSLNAPLFVRHARGNGRDSKERLGSLPLEQ